MKGDIRFESVIATLLRGFHSPKGRSDGAHRILMGSRRRE